VTYAANPNAVFPSPAKKKIVDDTVDWIRSNNANPDDIDESTLHPYQTKKPRLDEVIEWFRNNMPTAALDEPSKVN
jgi:hypothetical protein